ncbi:hypothetical protein PFRI_15340 [Planktotalea frisia]|uniref:Uncharacterized protein n=1 Tax=Planktotalea frisia TaxID=696762 RepID=A0A1L9NY81_9RHOB|nr:hypothetical protein PFRI_15340 [Planktotalea frisia]
MAKVQKYGRRGTPLPVTVSNLAGAGSIVLEEGAGMGWTKAGGRLEVGEGRRTRGWTKD